MEIYLDTGDWNLISKYGNDVEGFTTNPTLMHDAGVTQYTDWARWVAGTCAGGKPISLEVFADDFEEMEKQARALAVYQNAYIKIPITNTKGDSTKVLIQKLSREGLKLNITAITTHDQIRLAARALYPHTASIISVFCGRIADTGKDPVPFITTGIACAHAETKVLWASTREVYNIYQARAAGADIITVTPPILAKYKEHYAKNLDTLSLETVRQFHNDAKGIEF